MATVAFDLRHPDRVAHELGEANRVLAHEKKVPGSVIELVGQLAQELGETDARQLEAVDPYLWMELQRSALSTLAAMRQDDPRAQRRGVRIGLEQLRFVLTRLAERQPFGDDRPIEELLPWLDRVLAVPQSRKAELFGVADRTYQRWVSDSEPTRPDTDREKVVRLVARVASQLRHSLTGAGVVDWLEHPRDELDGARPIDRLGDPEATDQVLTLAAATRSPGAA